VWDAIDAMRTEDVHTQPVEIEEQQSSAVGIRDGKVVVRRGKVCVIKVLKYMVESNGKDYDALSLSASAIQLLRRFVNDLPSLVRP
jgi:hypothetical protein